jgi:CPA1 family monovalent cation:H+ antiporter
MTLFQSLALLVTVSALFAYLNHRWLRVPPAAGLMTMSLVASLGLIAVDRTGLVPLATTARQLLAGIDFNEAVMHGMLGALLFAGALHLESNDLVEHGVAVAGLAAGGTLLSTFVVAALVFALVSHAGPAMSFGHCLLFGALISPTDPVAVLGVLKRAGISKHLEVQIAGESLFNDGVGVVIFATILGAVTRGATTPSQILALFAREALGGAACGLATGWITYRLLRSIDHYPTELLLTLALALGGYALAERLHVSAPIAAVVSGLLIGNPGRAYAMSDTTRAQVDTFWQLVDEVLNAVLFVLMGFELILLTFDGSTLLLGVAAIPMVLLARAASVGIFVLILRRVARFERGSWAMLTWGGLRGGISVALALGLPPSRERDVIVVATYAVVVFSVLAQGLTIGRLGRRLGLLRA